MKIIACKSTRQGMLVDLHAFFFVAVVMYRSNHSTTHWSFQSITFDKF